MQIQSNTLRPPTRRAPDPYQPLALNCDRYLKVESFCLRHDAGFEDIFIAEMEVVEMPRSHAFDVSVTIFWERFSDDHPQNNTMISLARALTSEHFNNSPSSRVCGQRYGIHLHYPPVETSPDY